MNVTRCEASHGGTGGESPLWALLGRCSTADKGLSAKSSPRASASPRRDLSPAPHPAAAVTFDRRGESRLVSDLVGALLAHAEELGDLDKAERPHMRLTLAGLPVALTAVGE
jgi:hypothetical protein